MFLQFSYTGESVYLLYTGSPPLRDVYAGWGIQRTSFAQNCLSWLNDYILKSQAVKKPRNLCVSYVYVKCHSPEGHRFGTV
jgi:hypothetical protein